MRQLEALLVQAIENFQADAGAAFAAGFLPASHRLLAGGDQRFVIANRVLHIKSDAVGRLLASQPAALAGLVQFKFLAQVRFKCFLAIVGCRFAISLGARHLVIGRPVTTGVDGIECTF